MEKLSTAPVRWLILLIGSVLFLPFLGHAPLFDWDEINFAESAREMIITGNYSRVQINFQPFWEKPPLFFWMQAACMHLFGINEYSARLPNAIAGILTLISVFEIGRRTRNQQFGILWAACLAGSFLPHVYFKSGIIDPVFNYFIFLSVWFMYKSTVKPAKQSCILWSGLFAGLAVLTKGPVGLLIPLLVMIVYIISSRFTFRPAPKSILIWLSCVLLVSLAWFGPETIKNGPWFLEEFIRYQLRLFSTPDAGHGQPFYYHFVVVLLGCFPMSAFGLLHFFSSSAISDPFRKFMKILFWVVMILFSLVTTKIVHYSSLSYLPLAYVAATDLQRWFSGDRHFSGRHLTVILTTGSVIGLSLLLIPLIGRHPEWVMDLIKDPFARQNLQASVAWPWYTLLPGMAWFSGLLLTALFILKKQTRQSIYSLLGGVLIAVPLFLLLFPSRIAAYTQGAPVDFFKAIGKHNVYIETLGYKSYAQYFYSKKMGVSPAEKTHSLDQNGRYNIDVLRKWLLEGKTDKPVYFVVKTIHEQEYLKPYGLQCIGRKNGFTFLKRPLPSE